MPNLGLETSPPSIKSGRFDSTLIVGAGPLQLPLCAPFKGLLPTPGVGSFRLMLSYIVALAVYVLLHMAVNGLFRLFVHRKTAV